MWGQCTIVILTLMPQMLCLLSTSEDRNVSSLFDVAPAPVVTFTGEDAVFHCVTRCDDIVWVINDQTTRHVSDIDTRTHTVPRQDGVPGSISMLWITATVIANNSVIICVIEDWNNNNVERYPSPGVLLQIQDLLEPPTNIELQFQWNNDLLQAVLSWEQPFTLNITDQGYERNITYTVFVNRNSTYEVHNISATQFTYNLNYSSLSVPQSNRDICNNNYYTTFQVSAINRIGTGERSELIFLRDALCTSGPTWSTDTTNHIPYSTTKSYSINLKVPKPTVTTVYDTLPSLNNRARITMIAATSTGALLVVIIIAVMIAIAIKRKLLTSTKGQVFYDVSTNVAYEMPAATQWTQCDTHCENCHTSVSNFLSEVEGNDHQYQQCNEPEELYAEII